MQYLWVVLLSVLLCVPAFAANATDDDTLYDQVRIRIANDREIGGGRIDVAVKDGVVELTGKVKTAKQKDRAEKLTKKVKGVKTVVNRIQVSPV
jgi:hyperosmotically inducible periplasmic protein